MTFDLLTAVAAPEHPIHLDALLCGVLELRAQAQGRKVGDEVERLPLAAHASGCWKASALVFDVQERFNRFATRRVDQDRLVRDIASGAVGGRGDALNFNSGPFRNYLMTIPVIYARSATAWCIGDADEIRTMLLELPSIGRLGRNGYGAIGGEPVVEHDELAHRLWESRILPYEVADADEVFATVRYPYFDKTKQKKAWIPRTLSASLV
ncbi:MAG TPA: hypothetical protein VHE37_10500 [Nevskiaceae bacterium]|nr:hypothetical protein [Nevskiaceae bacterium]